MAHALTHRAVTTPASTTLPTYTQTAVGNDAWAYKTFVLRPALPEWEELLQGGADGVAVSTTNSTLTGIPSGGAALFETDGPGPQGSRYMRITSGGVSRVGGRTIVRNTGEKDFFRFYFRTDNPTGAADFWRLYDNVGAAVRVRLDLNGSGQINIRDVNTTRATTTYALDPDEWVRIEVRVNDTNDTLSLRLFYGANLHGTTADEEFTALTYTPNAYDEQRFGAITGFSGRTDFDAMAYEASTGAGAWVGPTLVNQNDLYPGTTDKNSSDTAAATDVVSSRASTAGTIPTNAPTGD